MGRRCRSQGGMIAMQVAGERAGITALDLMVWRQSNKLCSVHNFTYIRDGSAALLMVVLL